MILAVLLTSQASGFSLLPEPASVWDSASDRGFTIDGESNPRLRYVPGAETTLWFEDLSFSGEERWQIRSLDESIFQIGESSADSDGGLWAEGHAVGVGETFLYVERNEGRYPIPISVLLPDRVALTAPLLGDAPVEGAPLLLTRAGRPLRWSTTGARSSSTAPGRCRQSPQVRWRSPNRSRTDATKSGSTRPRPVGSRSTSGWLRPSRRR